MAEMSIAGAKPARRFLGTAHGPYSLHGNQEQGNLGIDRHLSAQDLHTWSGYQLLQALFQASKLFPSMEECEALCTQLAIMVQVSSSAWEALNTLRASLVGQGSERGAAGGDGEFKTFVDLTLPDVCWPWKIPWVDRSSVTCLSLIQL